MADVAAAQTSTARLIHDLAVALDDALEANVYYTQRNDDGHVVLIDSDIFAGTPGVAVDLVAELTKAGWTLTRISTPEYGGD